MSLSGAFDTDKINKDSDVETSIHSLLDEKEECEGKIRILNEQKRQYELAAEAQKKLRRDASSKKAQSQLEYLLGVIRSMEEEISSLKNTIGMIRQRLEGCDKYLHYEETSITPEELFGKWGTLDALLNGDGKN
jgi:hypothetical protein